MMTNLNFIQDQPRWRVWLVAIFAKIVGACIHVEGLPFGSNRSRYKQTVRGLAQAGAAGAKEE